MTITTDDVLDLAPTATVINAGKHAGAKEIRGAIRYRPADLLEPAHLALPIARDRQVILYAHDGPTDELNAIAEKMRGDGFGDVRILDTTLDAYERAGGATQEASTEQVVPPQRPDEVQDLDRRL
jgi:3-mercaptopyruvate sulfurtransferase SseA